MSHEEEHRLRSNETEKSPFSIEPKIMDEVVMDMLKEGMPGSLSEEMKIIEQEDENLTRIMIAISSGETQNDPKKRSHWLEGALFMRRILKAHFEKKGSHLPNITREYELQYIAKWQDEMRQTGNSALFFMHRYGKMIREQSDEIARNFVYVTLFNPNKTTFYGGAGDMYLLMRGCPTNRKFDA